MNFVPFEISACQTHDLAAFVAGASSAFIVPVVAYVLYRIYMGDRG